MPHNNIISSIIKVFPVELTVTASLDELRKKLALKINYLIEQDFYALVQLLYRIDINENKLKEVLNEHPEEDAGILIAEMIIERQAEKEALKKQFRQPDDIPDAEKW